MDHPATVGIVVLSSMNIPDFPRGLEEMEDAGTEGSVCRDCPWSVLHAHRDGMCSFPLGTGSSCSLCDIAPHSKLRFFLSIQKVHLYIGNKIIQDQPNLSFQCRFSSLSWMGVTNTGGNNLPFFQPIIPTFSSLQDVFPQGHTPAALQVIPT